MSSFIRHSPSTSASASAANTTTPARRITWRGRSSGGCALSGAGVGGMPAIVAAQVGKGQPCRDPGGHLVCRGAPALGHAGKDSPDTYPTDAP